MLYRLKCAIAAAVVVGSPIAANAQDFYRMGTLEPGGTIYTITSGFAQAINRHVPDVEVQVNATGSAAQHMLSAAMGETDFFMMSTILYHHMTQGTAMYATVPDAPELAERLRGIFNFPVGAWHALVYADSGIESFDDIAGRTVFLGPPSGGATEFTRAIVEGATGFTAGEDFSVANMGFEAAQQGFQDRRIDVLIFPSLVPGAFVQQMALTNELRLISLEDADFDKPGVQAAMGVPGRTRELIDPALYGGNLVNDEPVLSVGAWIGVGVRTDLPDELVYAATAAFWDNIADLHAQGPAFGSITLDTALSAFNMPLHAGALRYYEEQGVEIPEIAREN
ncbi:MAG: TAXI family TRAP transporter solute-binding subunit [Pararhodobacter sp.]|nr:TAXI family TRAP transporter solute-binding subunit [Pararhodobacter sp.]